GAARRAWAPSASPGRPAAPGCPPRTRSRSTRPTASGRSPPDDTRPCSVTPITCSRSPGPSAVGADGLRVLITNITLGSWTGTETFVRDLARGLLEAGDRPMVWSPVLRPLADELRADGVPVTAELPAVPAPPA